MTKVATLITTYIDAWNEKDPARRRELVSETFCEDADYVDPMMRGDGQNAIDAMIAGVQQQYADFRFELAAEPDSHNDRVRFTWHLVPGGGGAPVATGYDFGTISEDGRLRSVTGFLEMAQ